MAPKLVTPDYRLIDIDQMEPSIVRRRLRRWTKADEAAITPLVAGLRNKGALSGIPIQKPRYETNVYPLYYYWSHTNGLPHKQVYSKVVESFQMYTETAPDKSLLPHIQRLADTEIDILIEDREYSYLWKQRTSRRAERRSSRRPAVFTNSFGSTSRESSWRRRSQRCLLLRRLV